MLSSLSALVRHRLGLPLWILPYVLAVFMIFVVTLPAAEAEFGWDFRDYWLAAGRVSEATSPYAPAMIDGPIDAKGTDRYRYPPPLAVALQPLSDLSLPAATLVWLILGLAALYAALLAVNRLAPRPLSAYRLIALILLFVPFYVAVTEGNVTLVLTACYAMVLIGSWRARPAITGAGVAIGTLLKLEPLLFFVWLLARRDWRACAWALVIGLVIIGTSLLWPGAREGWCQYPTIVQNILAGSGDYAQNGAPLVLLERIVEPTIATWLRLATALGAVGITIALSRWQLINSFAAVSAISLLAFPVLWMHYLVILLVAGLALWQYRPQARPYLLAAYITAATSLSVISIACLLLAAAVGENKLPANPLSWQPWRIRISSS